MTAREHNNLLGLLFMVRGGLIALVGVIVGVFMAFGGVMGMSLGHRHDDQITGAIIIAGGVVGGLVIVGFGLLDLFAGTRIRRVSPIGRTIGIVLSILMLLSFPLGTALGIYGLWFLLGDMGSALYSGSEAPAGNYGSPNPPNQPPPNSWA